MPIAKRGYAYPIATVCELHFLQSLIAFGEVTRLERDHLLAKDKSGLEYMHIQFDIPDNIALELSQQPGGISQAAIEALALEGVRSGRLTEHQARIMLGISTRYGMDGFLKAHNVFLGETLDSVVQDSVVGASFLRR